MVKNCDLGHEMFFTIWTSQPANNIYISFVFLVQKKRLEVNVGEITKPRLPPSFWISTWVDFGHVLGNV